MLSARGCLLFYQLLPDRQRKWYLDYSELFEKGVLNLFCHCLAVLFIHCDSFGTRPKKMRISQRLFMRSMSILTCRSLTS